ncbi:MAG: hypothetical protein JWN06_1348 [Propionibacteriaceae bacterium]|nr:hypothetical protein [Propionibacteriaceae bacterium]
MARRCTGEPTGLDGLVEDLGRIQLPTLALAASNRLSDKRHYVNLLGYALFPSVGPAYDLRDRVGAPYSCRRAVMDAAQREKTAVLAGDAAEHPDLDSAHSAAVASSSPCGGPLEVRAGLVRVVSIVVVEKVTDVGCELVGFGE